MSTYDQRAQAQAARMLAPKPKGKGQPVTITVPGAGGTFDPATDTTSGASPPVTHDGSGVQTAYDARSIDGKVIQSGDVKFLLSPLKIDGTAMPRPVADLHTLTKADGSWAIKAVDSVSPAGLDALFKLQLRRA